MRVLFADGLNSLAHVAFGAVSGLYTPIVGTSLFIIYQLSEQDQRNTLIDVLEFAIGWAAARRFLP